MSTFPPVADYAFLSNCEQSCLVAPDGSVEWLCLPRPDSPSVFGALLDRAAGEFRFGPTSAQVPITADTSGHDPGCGGPAEEVPSLADQDACSARTVGLNGQARTRGSGAGRLMYTGACRRESRRCFSPGYREGCMT